MKNSFLYNYIGKILIGLSIIFVFPEIVALIYNESMIPFFIPQLICLIFGLPLILLLRKNEESINKKFGLKTVAVLWIIVSAIGALPLTINNDATYINALFESVSGFTTTGATIFKNVEILNKSILFWRSLTHFIGGIGILAFVIAIIPLSNNKNILKESKSDLSNPNSSKRFFGIKKKLIYLFGIYFFLTFLETVLLQFGGLKLFDSLLISMGTAGTGGFSILNSSLESYSIFCKYVVAFFMFLFGINFNIYLLICIKDFKRALKSEELRAYIFIFIISTIILFLNTLPIIKDTKQTILQSIFNVSSLITGTGYRIGSINEFSTTSRVVCLILMLIGGCIGSTCGGIKISRMLISIKSITRNIIKKFQPNIDDSIKYNGEILSEETVKNTNTFILIYIFLIILIVFIVSHDKYSLEITLNAVVSTTSNVGLCFNISDFANFSNFSKLVLSFGMLCGRLELYPIISLFTKEKNN